MSIDKRKVAIAVSIVSILLISGLLFISMKGEDISRDKELPSKIWVDRLNEGTSSRTSYLENKVILIDSVRDNAFETSIAISAASIRFISGQPEYTPLIMIDETGDALERYLSLSPREPLEVDPSIPEEATISFARNCYQASDLLVIYSSYRSGMKAVALSSYYDIPMVFATENSEPLEDLMDDLGVRFAISMDDGPLLSVPTMALGGTEPCHNGFFLWCLESKGDSSDYMIVTNPDDIDNGWGEPGYLPVRGVSSTSAQLAAYRMALMFFVKGYSKDEIGVNFDDRVHYNQMGASVEIANNYSDTIKDKVLHAIEEGNSTSAFDLKFLGIVGDPIAVPYHYEDFGDGGDDVFFSNTNFIASDYYFADTEGDEHQDIAYGRILGRSLTDTALLNARTMGFDEYSEYDFERGNDVDQRIYDTLSPDWKDNAGVFVGTTKPFPMPAALKHMKKYQYDVLGDGGMFVTTEESLLLNDVTADMVMDKMNYMMYCGHGLQSAWYSNYADNIDAKFITTQTMKPGFSAVMACLTGRVDNLDDHQDDKISLAFIHAGQNGYIGSTRLAYGLFKVGQGEQGLLIDTGALYLVDRISENFVNGGMTTGELLMISRNEMIDKWVNDDSSNEAFEASVAMWEYVLYGDPAWTPAGP